VLDKSRSLDGLSGIYLIYVPFHSDGITALSPPPSLKLRPLGASSFAQQYFLLEKRGKSDKT
jgi:hypothetical protein